MRVDEDGRAAARTPDVPRTGQGAQPREERTGFGPGEERQPNAAETRIIQERFGIVEQGYGPRTQEAVARLQLAHGIPVDDRVTIGPKTWALIENQHAREANPRQVPPPTGGDELRMVTKVLDGQLKKLVNAGEGLTNVERGVLGALPGIPGPGDILRESYAVATGRETSVDRLRKISEWAGEYVYQDDNGWHRLGRAAVVTGKVFRELPGVVVDGFALAARGLYRVSTGKKP